MDPSIILARHRRQGADVWLVTLRPADESVTVRYTNATADIVYDGQTYRSWNIQTVPPAADSDGGQPAADIVIQNVTRDLQVDLHNHDYFRGGAATLLSLNTYAGFASTAGIFIDEAGAPLVTEGDDTLIVEGDSYDDQIKRLEIINTETDRQILTVHLGLPQIYLDDDPQAIYGPKCSHQFKDGFCGYSGVETTCAHTLTACRAYGNEASFGGEPGMRAGGLRIGQ